MKTSFYNIIFGLIIALVAAGCRDSKSGGGGGGNIVPQVAFSVTQSTQNGNVEINVSNASITSETVDLVIVGNLRGVNPASFSENIASVTTSVDSLPHILDYVQDDLDKFDKVRISGFINESNGARTPLDTVEFDLTRLIASTIGLDFTDLGNGTFEWAITRTESAVLPSDSNAVKVKIFTRDTNGNEGVVFESNRDLGAGPQNGVNGGNNRLIRSTMDSAFVIEFTGPNFDGTVTVERSVPGGMVDAQVKIFLTK